MLLLILCVYLMSMFFFNDTATTEIYTVLTHSFPTRRSSDLPTGSGKTAAYGLGLLSRIDPALSKTQALVLCPTRELADQVAREIRALARFLPNIKLTILSGGIAKRPQLASLEHDPHIVVGKIGRAHV